MLGVGAGGFLVRIVGTVLTMGLTIAMTRTMGAAGYGAYAYAMAVSYIFVVLATFGLPISSNRILTRYFHRDRRAAAASFSLFSVLVIGVVTPIVGFVAAWPLRLAFRCRRCRGRPADPGHARPGRGPDALLLRVDPRAGPAARGHGLGEHRPTAAVRGSVLRPVGAARWAHRRHGSGRSLHPGDLRRRRRPRRPDRVADRQGRSALPQLPPVARLARHLAPHGDDARLLLFRFRDGRAHHRSAPRAR